MGDVVSFALTPNVDAFSQGGQRLVVGSEGSPSASRLDDTTVIVVHHAESSSSAARSAFAAVLVPWPDDVGNLQVGASAESPIAARTSPAQIVLLGLASTAARTLLDALAPGCASDAVAIDVSHGQLVISLSGPGLQQWLSRLVDASVIPDRPGHCARGRLIDVPVHLLRVGDQDMLLVADRALAPYLANWLRFSHDAAFVEAAT